MVEGRGGNSTSYRRTMRMVRPFAVSPALFDPARAKPLGVSLVVMVARKPIFGEVQQTTFQVWK